MNYTISIIEHKDKHLSSNAKHHEGIDLIHFQKKWCPSKDISLFYGEKIFHNLDSLFFWIRQHVIRDNT